MASPEAVCVPKTPGTEFIHTEIVNIVVGTGAKETTFQAHKNLLRERSPFLKAALSSQWTTTNGESVRLAKDDPEICALWLQLAYTGKLGLIKIPPGTFTYYHTIAKVYVFAEKLLDIEGKNLLIKAFLQRYRESKTISSDGKSWLGPTPSDINIIYTGTAGHDKMRKLVVDIWAQTRNSTWIEVNKDTLHKMFLADLVKRLLDVACQRWVYNYDTSPRTCAFEQYMEMPDGQNHGVEEPRVIEKGLMSDTE